MDAHGDIATHFRLDPAVPAVTLAGLRCYAAQDTNDSARRLIALQPEPLRPPRAKFLGGRALAPVPNLMMPVDQGPGRDLAGNPAWFLLCPAPPGPPLSASPAPWSEADLIAHLLLPAAAALEALADQDLTHRAIRPDNVFHVGRGERAILGPCWAAPPAYHQPAAFEPPYSAMCAPYGRGDGSIADDVYALGVTMLWCHLGGQVAWSEMDTIARKLAMGSFEALAGGSFISPILSDLLRIMLASDPEHRPSPSLLQDPTQARSRRLAQRPPQRASRAIEIGGTLAWSARELALCFARAPEAGGAALKSGAADRWLRRHLGDNQLAVALDDAVFRRSAEPEDINARTEPTLILRAVSTLDPLAPLVWRDVVVWPDGIAGVAAAALAPNLPALAATLEELIAADVPLQWAAPQMRRRAQINDLSQQSKDWRRIMTTRGPIGGLRRLAYTLNPQLACASPLLGAQQAVKLPALLPALEAEAVRADRTRPPIDSHIVAFAASHADGPMLRQLGSVEGFATAKDRVLVLTMLARLQALTHPAPLPGLCGWLLASGAVELTEWRNLKARKSLADGLEAAAQSGQISAMLQLLQSDAALEADRTGGARAEARVTQIAAELAFLRRSGAHRAADARRTGQDIAAGLGLFGAIAAATLLALAG
jgi:hypothetical protein